MLIMYHISGRKCYTCLSVDIFGYLIGSVLVFLVSCKKKFMHESNCAAMMSFDNRIWWRLLFFCYSH